MLVLAFFNLSKYLIQKKAKNTVKIIKCFFLGGGGINITKNCILLKCYMVDMLKNNNLIIYLYFNFAQRNFKKEKKLKNNTMYIFFCYLLLYQITRYIVNM